MKGIIFTTLFKLVEEKFGLRSLDQIIDDSKVPTKGVYTSGQTYPDSELVSLVVSLSKLSKAPVDTLIFEFGRFALGQFAKQYPIFFQNMNLKQFLMSVDSIVHVEVKKLYPDAELPTFRYEDTSSNGLIMEYSSKRKLCTLAEGLIQGASNYFQTPVEIKHTKCLKKGDSCCRLELAMAEQKKVA